MSWLVLFLSVAGGFIIGFVAASWASGENEKAANLKGFERGVDMTAATFWVGMDLTYGEEFRDQFFEEMDFVARTERPTIMKLVVNSRVQKLLKDLDI